MRDVMKSSSRNVPFSSFSSSSSSSFLLEGAVRRATRSRQRRSSSFRSSTTLSFSWSERRSNGARRMVSSSRVRRTLPSNELLPLHLLRLLLLHLLLLLLPPLLQGSPCEEGEGGGVDHLTRRPSQYVQARGRVGVPREVPSAAVEAASVPAGQSATREPPPPLSSPPSVPVGRRASQAPHHGCDAGPRRACLPLVSKPRAQPSLPPPLRRARGTMGAFSTKAIRWVLKHHGYTNKETRV